MKLYQVDAFVSEGARGNPAAVCPLENWLSDDIMQEIAEENNLSETAFFIPEKDDFAIRWFTPKSEVNLCGHATMAAAYVIYNELNYSKQIINFSSRSGILQIKKDENKIKMTFPKAKLKKLTYNAKIAEALGENYQDLYFAGEDYLVIFRNENEIKNLDPNFNLLKNFEVRGVVTSAPGINSDFVSRAFFPRLNVNEDPVCGSAHTHLAPYWSGVFNKNILHAKQISKRGGDLICEITEDKIIISGKCKLYLKGEILI